MCLHNEWILLGLEPVGQTNSARAGAERDRGRPLKATPGAAPDPDTRTSGVMSRGLTPPPDFQKISAAACV
jgi:hypothetical protein